LAIYYDPSRKAGFERDQLVDPAVLEKMKVRPVGEAESGPDHKAG